MKRIWMTWTTRLMEINCMVDPSITATVFCVLTGV